VSVDRIIERIEHEAEEEAAKIVADADHDARASVAVAEADVQAQIDAAIERVGPEIRAASQRRINNVRLRLLEERARDDAARLTAVFDAAEARSGQITDGSDPGRWSSALRQLCVEALRAVGEGASVTVRAADAGSLSGLAREWEAEVVPLSEDAEPGPVVTSRDRRIEVDARQRIRLERARSLLAESVARMLDLEPLDSGSRSVE
jgi:vacuolar-type H+-ATPase subunit E/Vma4